MEGNIPPPGLPTAEGLQAAFVAVSTVKQGGEWGGGGGKKQSESLVRKGRRQRVLCPCTPALWEVGPGTRAVPSDG